MIERPRFSTTRMREGYEVGDVDATIDRVMADLAGDRPTITPQEITELRFTPVRLGTGYDMGEVDTWLDEVVAELHRRGGDGASAATPQAAPPQAEARPGPTTPGAIEEVGRSTDVRVTVLAILGIVAVVLLLAYLL